MVFICICPVLLFRYDLSLCMSSLEKNLFKSLPIFNLDYWFPYFCYCWVVGDTYMFWILTLIRYMVCKYFSCLIGCLYHFVIVLFDVHKLFSFVYSYLLIFAFVGCTFDIKTKKIAKTNVKELFPCFVFVFNYFRSYECSLINFESIFVSWISHGFNFTFLHVDSQFSLSQHHLLKKLSFLYCMFLAPFIYFLILHFNFKRATLKQL